jgi:FPC/CPF motif-containing protein YcgG
MATAGAPCLRERFERRIEAQDFPCVGAKSALARGTLDFLVGGDLREDRHDARLLRELQGFARGQPDDAVFISRVVLFPDTPGLDEAQFEAALWQRLRALHRLDRACFDWDPQVSDDPDSPHFSMSLGGRAFYVIGLHPGASRPARRFDCAALVFNLHSQFEQLRDEERYDRLREAILERDEQFSGSRNPMLAVHGEQSEARQYSGRRVAADWQCPFRPEQAAGPRASANAGVPRDAR